MAMAARTTAVVSFAICFIFGVRCSWRGAVANGGGSWGGCVLKYAVPICRLEHLLPNAHRHLEEAVDDGDARHAVAPSSKLVWCADRAIDANSARARNRNALDDPAFPSDLI